MGVLQGDPFTLALYNDFDLTIQEVAFVSPVTTGTFETHLDGGFGKCSVTLDIRAEVSNYLYTKALGKRCRLYSVDGSVVHEGRIERSQLTEDQLTLSSLGNYIIGNDTLMGLIYPTSVPTSASDIIIDAIGLIDVWKKGEIEITTTDITPLDFFGDVKVNQAIKEVLKFGDDSTPPDALHFQVWEDGLCNLVAEPPNLSEENPKFIIKVGEDRARYSSTLSIEKVYNKIQAIYDDEDTGQTFTDPFEEDAQSQENWGVREGTINAGQVSEAVAILVAEIALAAYSKPEQTRGLTIDATNDSIVLGHKPIYLIRAGDIISIDETSRFGITGLSVPPAGSGTTKAIVAKTSYNISSRTMTLTPGSKTQSFDLLLAQLGFSGGSVN